MTKKKIVITGGARGIGRAIATLAADEGYDVLASIRNLDEDARSLEKHPNISLAVLDVANRSSIERFAEKVQIWSHGNFFALINNAGISIPVPIEMMTPADLRMQFEVNTFGQIELTQKLLPTLKRNRGRIMMISSASVYLNVPMVGAYGASKRALEAMTEALYMELQGTCDVILVRPGPYNTSIWARAVQHGETYTYADSEYLPLAELAKKFGLDRSRQHDPSKLAQIVLSALSASKPRFLYEAPLSSKLLSTLRKLLPDALYPLFLRAGLRMMLPRTAAQIKSPQIGKT